MSARATKPGSVTDRLRCAIYTRKSSEEGLDQEFNSLDAQREACSAYILSQRHEGWALVPELYDDGGYSGGNMDRPGLRQLMADVEAGRVDVIVVYKVDRLTRSLADFAKIVEVLDRAGASFVSVTQAFNTTTSMGRLTLNVLLSFAQFEREVTGERIRDKIAASKAKGIWMGGPVPLGYRAKDRKLQICAEEATLVRKIFARFLELRTIGELVEELAATGIRTRERTLRNGTVTGGVIFSKGAVAHLLKNPVYIGEVQHKGSRHAGEHEAIISPELWAKVQSILAENRRERRLQSRAEHPSLLAAMLFDEHGRPMTPSHAVKGSRRYRYYVSRLAPDETSPEPTRIPAADIERLVCEHLRAVLAGNSIAGLDLFGEIDAPPTADGRHLQGMLASKLAEGSAASRREALQLLQFSAHLCPNEVQISFTPPAEGDGAEPANAGSALERSLSIPVRFERRGRERKLVHMPPLCEMAQPPDSALVALLTKAHAARTELSRSVADTCDPKARPYLTRLARLAFLAPDITSAILQGKQPPTLTSRRLLRAANVPLGWQEQREVLDFATAEDGSAAMEDIGLVNT